MKEEPPLIEWVCKKCGLKRSNKQTHKHGVEMVKEKIK